VGRGFGPDPDSIGVTSSTVLDWAEAEGTAEGQGRKGGIINNKEKKGGCVVGAAMRCERVGTITMMVNDDDDGDAIDGEERWKDIEATSKQARDGKRRVCVRCLRCVR
jgi:hypothetical protein